MDTEKFCVMYISVSKHRYLCFFSLEEHGGKTTLMSLKERFVFHMKGLSVHFMGKLMKLGKVYTVSCSKMKRYVLQTSSVMRLSKPEKNISNSKASVSFLFFFLSGVLPTPSSTCYHICSAICVNALTCVQALWVPYPWFSLSAALKFPTIVLMTPFFVCVPLWKKKQTVST